MKKLVALLLAGVMAFGCVACGNSGETGNETEKNSEIKIAADANEILTKTWEEYNIKAGDDLKFPIGGGNVENMVMDAPAKFDLTLEGAQDTLSYSYCIPSESIAMTDDVATMIHMMNANNFTAAAYHVTDAFDVKTVIESIEDTTLNNQWMCGFPEKLIVLAVGDDYVVSAFGNGQIIEMFKTAIVSVYGDSTNVVVETDLAQ